MHTNTWIVYFYDEVCNVSYIWLRWIYLPSTTKVFPFLENGNISTFGYFPPWCQYDCFWWLRKFVCLDVFFTKWKTTSFSCGYRWCFWFLLGSSKWPLLMMTGFATISLSTAGNQFCVGQGGVIRIVLADSFIILFNTCQMSLKDGKQWSKYFFHAAENASVAMESVSGFQQIYLLNFFFALVANRSISACPNCF